MKLGQIFRELLIEEGYELNEDNAKEADSFIPESTMVDVPDDLVPRLKELLRPQIKPMMERPIEVCRDNVMKHQQNN